jgi:hypothetical protein
MPAKDNPNDTLLVRNIDIDCTDHSVDFLKTTRVVIDEDGNRLTEFIEIPFEFDHAEEFQVRWGGQKFRIAPGDTRKMPRHIAEHYAKYLATHILQKRELEEKRPGLIEHPIERPKVMEEILIGVDQYWDSLGELDEGAEALKRVDELNQPIEAPVSDYASQFGGGKGTEIHGEVDAGTVSRDPMTAKKQILSTEEVLDTIVESEIENKAAPEEFKDRTKHDLVKEIRQQDPLALLTGKETKNQLVNILRRF